MKRLVHFFIFSLLIAAGVLAVSTESVVRAAAFCSHDYTNSTGRCEQYFPAPYNPKKDFSSADKVMRQESSSATWTWPTINSGTFGTRFCQNGVCAPFFPRVIETATKTGEAGKDAICKGLGANIYSTCADVNVAIKGKPARYEWGTIIRTNGSVPQDWNSEYWSYYYSPSYYKYSNTYPCGFASKYVTTKREPYYKPGQYVTQTLSVTNNMPDKYNFHTEYLHLARGLMLCVLRTFTDSGAYQDNWIWLTPQWPSPATVNTLTANGEQPILWIEPGELVSIDWTTSRATQVDVSSSQGDIPANLIDDSKYNYSGNIYNLAPTKDTTYSVYASNAGGGNSKNVDVKIKPLSVYKFVGRVDNDNHIILNWGVYGATSIKLEASSALGTSCFQNSFNQHPCVWTYGTSYRDAEFKVTSGVDTHDTIFTLTASNNFGAQATQTIGIKGKAALECMSNGLAHAVSEWQTYTSLGGCILNAVGAGSGLLQIGTTIGSCTIGTAVSAMRGGLETPECKGSASAQYARCAISGIELMTSTYLPVQLPAPWGGQSFAGALANLIVPPPFSLTPLGILASMGVVAGSAAVLATTGFSICAGGGDFTKWSDGIRLFINSITTVADILDSIVKLFSFSVPPTGGTGPILPPKPTPPDITQIFNCLTPAISGVLRVGEGTTDDPLANIIQVSFAIVNNCRKFVDSSGQPAQMTNSDAKKAADSLRSDNNPARKNAIESIRNGRTVFSLLNWQDSCKVISIVTPSLQLNCPQ